jgi:hypothetical protein
MRQDSIAMLLALIVMFDQVLVVTKYVTISFIPFVSFPETYLGRAPMPSSTIKLPWLLPWNVWYSHSTCSGWVA